MMVGSGDRGVIQGRSNWEYEQDEKQRALHDGFRRIEEFADR
jgi:hypothetical protein